MKRQYILGNTPLSIDTIWSLIHSDKKISLSPKTYTNIKKCRDYLDDKLNKEEGLIYGINTGFGSLCNIKISNNDRRRLQEKLIQSHACGTGEEVPLIIIKLILLLKIQSLSLGHSGVRKELVDRLLLFYNEGIYPQLFQQGSLGASGDLAPLAHLSLPIIGRGQVYYQEKLYDTADLYQKLNIQPLSLRAKEGIALLNGTQFSTAYAVWSLAKGLNIFYQANICAAISMEGFDCQISPFDERLHQVRPHEGQLLVAKMIREFINGSQIVQQEKIHTQDPYSFRCVPQVHGATWQVINHVREVLETEINSVTDNPNIFPEDDTILSGGNFHAQPIALASDYLAMGLSELGSISERRLYQLIGGQRDLPDFLTPSPGLNSGMMIPQYTAASIVSQNKQLCTPASVDTIVSCNGQEDHVSMAANAGTKLYRIVQNVEQLLAIELMAGIQALEFRRPLRSSAFIESIVAQYRKVIPRLEEDRFLGNDMKASLAFLKALDR